MAVVTTNLGVITAYGDAVAAGYTGTKAEWQTLMANYATVGTQAAQDAQTASQAAQTASQAAQTATTKAGEASQSATRAETAAASITTPDATLTQAGVAADAKATGDEIGELKSGLTLIAEKSLSPTWESGNISTSTGREGTNASYIRTKAIDAKLLANAKVTVSEDSAFKYGVYLFRYYADGSFDSKISNVLEKGDAFSLPVNNAEYVRFVARRSPASADISVDGDSANLSLSAMVSVTKSAFEPYTADHIRFSISVNTQFPTDGDGTGTLDGETMQDIPCILRLPSNYDPSGEPVPLIMFSHGTGTSVTDDSTTGQIDNYFTYVGDSKCAVFDCNGMVVGSGTVEGMNLGSPIAVQAFHKAYEYIIRHYNVRKDLIVGGNSQGGLAALNFVNSYPNIVRCMVLAYPVTSLKEQAWDDPWRSEVKPAIASVFNFTDTTGETWEADKVVGYDPLNNRAVTVGDEHRVFLPVPIKIWHGSADTVVAYQGSVNYINSVKSAGIPAYLRTISGGTHGASSVTNAFYREAKYFIRRFL